MMFPGWLKEAVAGEQGRVSFPALNSGRIDGSYTGTARAGENLTPFERTKRR